MLVRQYKDFETLKNHCNSELPDVEDIDRRIVLDLNLEELLKVQSDISGLFKPMKGERTGQSFCDEVFMPGIGTIKIINNVS